MAAADDDRPDPDAAGSQARRSDDGTTDAHADRPPSLPTNIERVADKVKGLLRSDR